MKKNVYKLIDLFDNENIHFDSRETRKKDKDSYESFVDKFKPKKTTDDCYTPKLVYDAVLEYVRGKCNINGLEVVRPFFPGGDYENYPYHENCVVIDNPPFSIVSKIVKFYVKKGIKFFLFAPHLTLFSANLECTAIVVSACITYENGAVVRTSFYSNLFTTKILGEPSLLRRLNEINEMNKVNLPSYKYPKHVLTVSHIEKIIAAGVNISFESNQVKHIGGLDSQRRHRKAIYGSGYLLSEKAAAEKAAAEKAAAEKAAAEKKVKAEKIEWQLSEREMQIIEQLNKSDH